MKLLTNALLLSLFIFLSACSMSKNMSLAEKEVPNFHAQLDAGQFKELYESAAEELKTTITKQDFIALLSAVNRKLGRVIKSEKTTWSVNYNTSGSFVSMTYNTTFTKGTGMEQFIFRLHDGRALLVSYHINSNALIIN